MSYYRKNPFNLMMHSAVSQETVYTCCQVLKAQQPQTARSSKAPHDVRRFSAHLATRHERPSSHACWSPPESNSFMHAIPNVFLSARVLNTTSSFFSIYVRETPSCAVLQGCLHFPRPPLSYPKENKLEVNAIRQLIA